MAHVPYLPVGGYLEAQNKYGAFFWVSVFLEVLNTTTIFDINTCTGDVSRMQNSSIFLKT